MAWDIVHFGNCKQCGLRIHASFEDHAGICGLWACCPACHWVDAITIDCADAHGFWAAPPPCPRCAGAIEKWDCETCPRCGQPAGLAYTMVAD